MKERKTGRPRATSHDEIRDAALRLFAEQGYEQTSLAGIAAEVGISRTTLFNYFPAKRDLIWEDHDAAVLRLRDSLNAAQPGEHAVDVLVRGMLAVADYSLAQHGVLAGRRRIVRADEQLRADVAAHTEELNTLLVSVVLRLDPRLDAQRLEQIARALMAVSSQCTETWAESDGFGQDLQDYTEKQLLPFVVALRPLLRHVPEDSVGLDSGG